jgi:hypothetical protein
MRGLDERSGDLFSYVDLEERVPVNHPLRLIRRIVNEVLVTLDGEFAKIYAASGRPSISPERLLRALLLQAFYTIRSETQPMEQHTRKWQARAREPRTQAQLSSLLRRAWVPCPHRRREDAAASSPISHSITRFGHQPC